MSLRARIAREAFQPGWLGLLLNPFYFARRGLWEELAALAPAIHGRVLDVGCGRKPYAELFHASEYLGLELDTRANRAARHADLFYDGKTLPFDDARFESVLAFEVLEHVFTPDAFLDELQRVLTAGGVLLLTVPFVWDEHEQPVDYGRYSSFGLKHLLERHGFEVVEQRKTMNDARALFQLANGYLRKQLGLPRGYWQLFAGALLTAPVNLAGALAGALLPPNDDFYLDNVVLARKR